ncbi:MAG: DUF6444 domain-containing protein [Verrucomicrobiales bacterium]
MILEGVDRKELEALAEAGALVTISASQLLAVIVRFEQLEEKVASLESNSRNSSKPPSSDRHNPNKPKKPRGKKGKRKRKPGGQKGHTGKTLKQVADPDHVEDHKLDRRGGKCDHCQGSLRGTESTGFEKRQVFDLPKRLPLKSPSTVPRPAFVLAAVRRLKRRSPRKSPLRCSMANASKHW